MTRWGEVIKFCPVLIIHIISEIHGNLLIDKAYFTFDNFVKLGVQKNGLKLKVFVIDKKQDIHIC